MTFVRRQELYKVVNDTKTTSEAKKICIEVFDAINPGSLHVDSFLLGIGMGNLLEEFDEEDYLPIRWAITDTRKVPYLTAEQIKNEASQN